MDEVDAGGEIAPLVRAAGLQGAPVRAVELEEVQRLEQLVAELRVGDPSWLSNRRATASLRIIWLTRKCLPMSRRKSSADIGAVQSRLSTRIAGYAASGSVPSKSRNGRTRS